MGILTNSGRAAMAKSIKAMPIHLAWGSGDPSWDTTPVAESVTDVALVSEIGRRIATSVQYCTPDIAGSIIVPSGQFSVSEAATRYLYIRFNFDFTDASTSTIREIAVFVGTQTDAGLPGGQMYFLPADITDPGMLLVIERPAAFTRSPSVRQSFEFVITT